jgi:hypothetical protein
MVLFDEEVITLMVLSVGEIAYIGGKLGDL